MKYGSICSGIESASMAWEPLRMSPAWFAEIEPFPSAVLAHHWPSVVNFGDMCSLPYLIREGIIEAPDVLVGGTPCQAFSVAGRRRGLDDERGQLTLKYVEIVNEIDRQRPGDECVAVWENVPGVLSSRDNAFGCFLGELVGEECELVPSGKKWSNAGVVYGPKRAAAWRILDAQYFGVAQRRRRVFVVASARNGFDPTTVLFEREGLRRDIAPSREAGASVAALTANGVGTCGADDNQGQAGHLVPTHDVTPCLQERGNKGVDSDCTQALVMSSLSDPTHTLRGEGFDASEDGTGRGTPIVAFAQDCADTITSVFHKHHGCAAGKDALPRNHIFYASAVRHLTPVECERLQGFPDNHTRVPWRKKSPDDCPNGPRYKSIGNSKAVPVVRWLGVRLLEELNK